MPLFYFFILIIASIIFDILIDLLGSLHPFSYYSILLLTPLPSLLLQVSLRALAQQVVYTDVAEVQTISGGVTLSAVHVAGNVDVMSINGVDLRHLDANTVKTTGDFVLQGEAQYCTLSASF